MSFIREIDLVIDRVFGDEYAPTKMILLEGYPDVISVKLLVEVPEPTVNITEREFDKICDDIGLRLDGNKSFIRQRADIKELMFKGKIKL